MPVRCARLNTNKVKLAAVRSETKEYASGAPRAVLRSSRPPSRSWRSASWPGGRARGSMTVRLVGPPWRCCCPARALLPHAVKGVTTSLYPHNVMHGLRTVQLLWDGTVCRGYAGHGRGMCMRDTSARCGGCRRTSVRSPERGYLSASPIELWQLETVLVNLFIL